MISIEFRELTKLLKRNRLKEFLATLDGLTLEIITGSKHQECSHMGTLYSNRHLPITARFWKQRYACWRGNVTVQA
jgi:hypothetical protein